MFVPSLSWFNHRCIDFEGVEKDCFLTFQSPCQTQPICSSRSEPSGASPPGPVAVNKYSALLELSFGRLDDPAAHALDAIDAAPNARVLGLAVRAILEIANI
jgi:hypothetical protein